MKKLFYKHFAGAYSVYTTEVIKGGGIRRYTMKPITKLKHDGVEYDNLHSYRMCDWSFENIKNQFEIIEL